MYYISIRLDEEDHEKLRAIALMEKLTLTEVVRRAVRSEHRRMLSDDAKETDRA